MTTPPAARAPITLGTSLSYAVGNIGMQMLVAGMSFFLMIFYTDVALVPPAVAGAALLIGKVWDTVNDPLLGWLTDRTRSRFGRRRVYLWFGAAPLAVLGAAVWMMPPGLSMVAAFVWIALSYTAFDTVLTLVQLPYSALSVEMTRDYDERTSLTAVASFGALLGYVLGSVLMPLIVRAAPDARTGYALAGAVFGLIAGAAVAWVAWRVQEPPLDAVRKQASPPWRDLLATFANRPFLNLVAACGLVRLGLTVVQGSLAYYVVYVLQDGKDQLPRLMMVLLGVVGASLFVWKRIVDRWEKNYAYIAGLVCGAAGMSALYWLQPGQHGAMMCILVVVGIGMGAHWVVPFSMMPDTVDHGHLLAGERRTGIYVGLFGLVDKLARTLATALVAVLLDLSGYVPNVMQSASAVQGIRLATGPIPAACLLLAIPLLLFYPITRARHAAIARQFEAPAP